MAIENRDLAAGTKLIAKYKKEEFKAEVVAGEDGKVNTGWPTGGSSRAFHRRVPQSPQDMA